MTHKHKQKHHGQQEVRQPWDEDDLPPVQDRCTVCEGKGQTATTMKVYGKGLVETIIICPACGGDGRR